MSACHLVENSSYLVLFKHDTNKTTVTFTNQRKSFQCNPVPVT
jgi:hypothetical protein